MSSLRRRRPALTAIAVAVAVGGLVAVTVATLSAPAEAAPTRNVFTQSTPVLLGETTYGVGTDDDVAIPAAGTTEPSPLELEVQQAAQIVDLRVTVQLAHEHPSDLELVLVGPTGERVVLLNGAGGEAYTEANPTFSDTAADILEDEDEPLTDGDLQPASFGTIGLTIDPPVTGAETDLSVFDGTDADGTWRLYVNDDEDHGEDPPGALYSWGLQFELAMAPYPSTLSVSGIGEVTDVNVSLHDIDSTYPGDIDVLLVGPQGHQSVVMSDAGGEDDVSGLDLTLDDTAAAMLSQASALSSGSFKPTNHLAVGPDTYPAVLNPTQTADLKVFNGSDPNGVWSLYAVDDTTGDVSAILGGWSLDIEWNGPDTTAPTGAVTLSGGSAYATSTTVSLSLTATDAGPGASGVRQMRFSNDGTSFSAWQPYATVAAWTLANGKDGTRTVYAQFADTAGNASAVVSDTLTLDTTAPTAEKIKPAKNAAGVKPTARVKVVASEALDKVTVTKKTVRLKQGSKKVTAKVSLKKGTTIVLKPTKPLADGRYKVTVTRLVRDLAGNAFDAKRKKKGTQTLTWTFTV